MPKNIREISWKEFHNLVDIVALRISISDIKYDYIYGIPRGGLIPATMLSHILEIPVITHLEYDVLSTNKILVVDV